MDYYKLNSGFSIPQILYGTWEVTEQETLEKCFDAALSAGYRGIDTAEAYSNDSIIGSVLDKLLRKHSLQRKDIFITSKLSPASQGYDSALKAIDQILSNLKTDYLDLFLIHWPGSSGIDSSDPRLRENRKASWKALEAAVAAGKIRSIGVSNYKEQHLEEMKDYSQTIPAVNQCECHPKLAQNSLRSYCIKNGIHFQAYSSLGSKKGCQSLLEHPVIKEVAGTVGRNPAQILLRWGLQKQMSVLPRSTNPDRVKDNFGIFGWTLAEKEMVLIDKLDANERFCWDPSQVL